MSTESSNNLSREAREDRSALLKMAEEWDRLADEQEDETDPAHEEE